MSTKSKSRRRLNLRKPTACVDEMMCEPRFAISRLLLTAQASTRRTASLGSLARCTDTPAHLAHGVSRSSCPRCRRFCLVALVHRSSPSSTARRRPVHPLDECHVRKKSSPRSEYSDDNEAQIVNKRRVIKLQPLPPRARRQRLVPHAHRLY
ncbi:hypothetical protein K438DRAFT_1955873 [Mycena galopus ATCC 62051]|nr:hypothetical protein K438DRAFT_1955873 [Mycena galopus ATCC 62051]